eukprot:TRINITY_DN21862_c0_g1_i3.p1 TRINITY_DN21862_c0_g1~~TRINITY_DN21862_c0_g1_i3.p1  ORF type:complete len:570 (-),score=104.67 TRINITY_DN21862_c0_g1_i3:291-2000(-)
MNALWGACSSVRVPTALTIENVRLGLLLRVLQLAAAAFVLFNFISSEGAAWSVQVKPTGHSISLWSESILPEVSNSSLAAPSPPSWCTDAGLEALALNDGTFDYRPTDCRKLPPGENMFKDGGHVYFPAYIWDTFVTESSAGNCGTCNGPGEVLETNGAHCKCMLKEQYLVIDVDTQMIIFNHGYKVKYGHKPGTLKFRNGEASGSSREEHILTVFKPSARAQQRKMKCEVGGRSKHGESPNGIRGTLAEYLACAGVVLDDRATSSGVINDNDTPHHPQLRLSGVALRIHLNYIEHHKYAFPGIVCEITIEADEVWNSKSQLSYSQVPRAGTGDGSYRFRYMFGVSVDEDVLGTFTEFDYDQLIKFLAAQLVILGLPTQVVTYVALCCVGVLSTVYDRAVNRRFHINNKLSGFCTRLIGHTETFKAVTGKSQGVKELSAEDLAKSLRVSFDSQFENGTLDDKEVMTLATTVLDHLDEGGSGTVTAVEFLKSSTGNEDMSMPVVAKLFDQDRKPGIGEKLFSNLLSNRRQARVPGDAVAVIGNAQPARAAWSMGEEEDEEKAESGGGKLE